jgi:hypothetical protein
MAREGDMMILQFIQNIATGSAILVGFTYILGGLIVNLNLARRGLVEYQILKVKYLVVGIIFLLQSIGVFIFAAIPAFTLAVLDINSIYVFEIINIISMSAALSLLLAWARLRVDSKSQFVTWNYWFVASVIGAVFPVMVLFRHLFFPVEHILRMVIIGQAVLTAALVVMAQVYHYSAFYYGRMRLGAIDPIGVGIPTRAQMAFDEKDIRVLQNLGVPVQENNITEDLFLIDETDRYYIIGFYQEDEKSEKTLKIDKDAVKAILYRPK